jgi:hypothetical protein
MNRSTLRLFVTTALVAAPAVGFADSVQQARCTSDSLDPAQAIARLEWARKCGLILNSGGWTNSFDSMWFDQAFNPAKEYSEASHPDKAYSGNSNAYTINYQYALNMFPPSPVYNQIQEPATSPTPNYYKWSRPSTRLRPLYPSFDTIVTGTGTQLFPAAALANENSALGPVLPWQTTGCGLFTKDATTGVLTPWTGNFYVSFYCESSCYTPDQSLRFSTGDVNILEAVKSKRDDVVTLTPDATLDNIETHVDNVYSYTLEIRDAEQVIYKIKTASGGTLSVTNEHPVLVSDGRLVKAETLQNGDRLVRANGKLDPIVHVERTTFFGKVYNMKPMSEDLVSNILIAQGFLVGSARFQNDDVNYMNRVLLLRGVPDEVMPM